MSEAPDTLPRVEIRYCTRCKWLLRAAWLAQELLSTFPDQLGEVALRPGPSGEFTVRLDGDLIWDRRANEGFPEAAELKRRVRDRIDPERSLGHVDGTKSDSIPPRED